MMLCIKDGYWYIAQRIRADSPGCAIDVGPMMPHGEGFKALPPVGAVLYRSLPSLDGIRFFPLLRYRGYEVWPMRWHP